MLHATLVAAHRRGRWAGVLLEGPSGAGKSGLALQLMQSGWRLVADDRVLAWTSGGRLFGRAPGALQGLIEVRGLGVVPAPALRFAEIALAVACLPPGAAPERVPEPETRGLLGHALPLIRLNAHEAGGAAKLQLALRALRFDSV